MLNQGIQSVAEGPFFGLGLILCGPDCSSRIIQICLVQQIKSSDGNLICNQGQIITNIIFLQIKILRTTQSIQFFLQQGFNNEQNHIYPEIYTEKMTLLHLNQLLFNLRQLNMGKKLTQILSLQLRANLLTQDKKKNRKLDAFLLMREICRILFINKYQ